MFALLTITSTLCATLHSNDCCDSLYVGGFGGVDFMQKINGRQNLEVKSKTGYVAGAAIGYNLEDILRVEAEFAYRHHAIRTFKFNGLKIDGHMKNETFSGMANVYYDIALGCDLTHYVGVGIGYAHNRVTFPYKRSVDFVEKANGFAYQAIAGISYRLPEELSSKTLLALEYRFFATKNHVKDHSVAANVKRYF